MMLTAEEADILCRLEDELHPLKGYVPHIVVVDIEKSEEEARKLQEKKAAEEKAAKEAANKNNTSSSSKTDSATYQEYLKCMEKVNEISFENSSCNGCYFVV